MNIKLQKSIRQILIAGAATLVTAASIASVGPQNPPPGPGQVPDYFGVVPNYANSPQPRMIQVTITDTTGTGAIAAATTYDYVNAVNTNKVMDVQLVNGGANYSANTIVTVTGGISSNGVASSVTLTPTIINGVITGFKELANSQLAGWTGIADQTGTGFVKPIAGTGIRKFVDTLPTFNTPNNLGMQISVAVPDTTTFPGSDYYEIAEVSYTQQMNSDLPATHLRGYVQLNVAAGSPSSTPSYMGPAIVAQANRPVRIKLVNQLPTGAAGALPFPVDHTYMGSAGGTDTDNRTALHLHGGVTPWISDGTPRQWIKPVGEAGPNKGISTVNVPDMWFDATGKVIPSCAGALTCAQTGASNNPGDGALTYYFTNQQTQRLQFYHDHAEGVTRLNVYAGMAAPYLIQDPTEAAMTTGGSVNGVSYPQVLPPINVPSATNTSTVPNDVIPLVIQEKTFVPDDTQPVLNFYGAFKSTLNSSDPTWRWGSGVAAPGLNGTGDLWVPHVYMTNQNPGDVTGANNLGRWDYGPWFWPPFTGLINQPVNNPYYDPTCVSSATVVCEAPQIPGVPNGNLVTNDITSVNPSATTEAFNDTPLVNGTVYPYMQVDPKKYRLRILSVGNDRTLNLNLVVAASKNSPDTTATGNLGNTNNTILCDGTTAVNPADCTEVKMVPFNATQDAAKPFPTNWYSPLKGGITFDDRRGGVFDPATAGPALVQIGTEGGFLASPAVIQNQPINFEYNPKNIVIGSVKEHALLLGPAERADVIVDFSQFAGSTVILYNDGPAPIPAFDLRYDLYTGNSDNTDTGGAFTTLPGYGPNSRTLLQFRVASACSTANCGSGINKAPAVAASSSASRNYVDQAWLNSLTTAVNTAFLHSQDPIIVPQNAYNAVYGTNVNDVIGSNVSRISDNQINFTPIQSIIGNTTILGSTPITLGLGPKSIIEDFTAEFGRMAAMLGMEMPKTTATTQTSIPQAYIDPPTELVKISPNDGSPVSGQLADGTQLWKITHNGVDTHAVHFHLFNVQLINRVGWDGMVRMPDANETGWKEVVRMNPLEDAIVALRPKKMSLPFKIPNSHHLLDPSASAGSTAGFYNLNPTTGNSANLVNTSVNYGWEYIWHCHILGHEENDMMRTIAVAQQPDDPSALQQSVASNGNVTLNWTDNSMISNWVTIQRDTVSTFNSANLTTLTTVISECASQTGCPASYTDKTAVLGGNYYYRVMSNNTVGSGDVNAKLPTKLVSKLTPGFTGYDNVTASSNWSVPVAPLIGIANISANSLTFANQTKGVASAVQNITLSNTGNGPLLISNIALTTGTNYTLTNGCPASLAANSTCTLGVSFKPTTTGALTDTLTITDNSNAALNSKQTITLSGTGVAPLAVVTPANLTFTSTNTGSTSAVQNVTVSNTGTDNLLISAAALTTGTNYVISNGCPASLAPAANCTIGVSFKPTAGGTLTDKLTITDNTNAVAGSKQTVTLSGTGVAVPLASTSVNSLALATTAVNGLSAYQTVTLSNVGKAAMTINSIVVTAPFTRPAGTTAATGGTCNTSLAINASCTINVKFNPTTVGAATGSLTITDNSNAVAGSTQVVSLTGSTPAVLAVTGTTTFSAVTGGNYTADYTVTNNGPIPVTLAGGAVSITGTAANTAMYSQTNTCNSATLPVNGSCNIALSFKPTSTGAKAATISVANPAPGVAATLALNGTGVAPTGSASPTTLAFGSVAAPINKGIATATTAQTVTVTNTSTGSLVLTASAITVPAQFVNAGTGTCANSLTLAAGASCTVNVAFKPTGTHSTNVNLAPTVVTGNLAINSNASPAITAALTGYSR